MNLLNQLRVGALYRVNRRTLTAGVWLRFWWADDIEVFKAGEAAIRALPVTWRRWDENDGAGWVSVDGMGALAEDIPAWVKPSLSLRSREPRLLAAHER